MGLDLRVHGLACKPANWLTTKIQNWKPHKPQPPAKPNPINPKRITQRHIPYLTLQNKMTQHVLDISSPHSLYVVPSSPSLLSRCTSCLTNITIVTSALTPPHTCATHALFSPCESPHHNSIYLFRCATTAPPSCHHYATATTNQLVWLERSTQTNILSSCW